MRRRFARIHRFVTRAETYLSFFGLLASSGVFTYLARQWDTLNEYSALSLFVASFVLIALAICTASLAYLAGSRFRERREMATQPLTSDSVTTHPIVAAVAALEFGDRIYVADMAVSAGSLEELCIQISIRAYNVTGETIRIDRVRGYLTAVKKVKGLQVREGVQLPSPQIKNDRHLDAGTPDQSEFYIVLEQRVPPAVATDIQNLADGESIQFECGNLSVIAEADAERTRKGKLCLWDAVTITRSPYRLISGRVISGRGILRAGAAHL